jgi:hypothetical protein
MNVVCCRDGVTHSGLFCVVLWLLDQLAVEAKIDLLFAVLHIRQSRPQIIKKVCVCVCVYHSDVHFQYFNT